MGLGHSLTMSATTCFEIPRQHLLVVLDGLEVPQPLEQECQVGVRLNAVGFAGLDER